MLDLDDNEIQHQIGHIAPSVKHLHKFKANELNLFSFQNCWVYEKFLNVILFQ